jgi:predicted DsbA family dithiol-disulfide isomerase
LKQIIALGTLLLALTLGTSCQNATPSMSQETTNNPLLCDPKQGVCEVPTVATTGEITTTDSHTEKPIKIIYFTDPICSSCWGIEPQLRRMKMEYGKYIDIEYCMGGLLPSWEGFNGGGISKPSDVYHHWEEVSHHYEMPMVGDVWLKDPLPSSYPPSIAFKAAQMQDQDKAILFLRRLREMVFVEAKNITRPEFIAEAAVWAGLDAKQLEADSKGKAISLFEQDLLKARQMGVRGFPTVFFNDASGNRLTIYGARGYEEFAGSIKRLASEAIASPMSSDALIYFKPFNSLTAKELSVFTTRSMENCITTLNQLEKEGKTHSIATKNGVLWRLNP